MRFIKRQKVPQKKDCMACLEAEPQALRTRSWRGVKDYVRNRITSLRNGEQATPSSRRLMRDEDEEAGESQQQGRSHWATARSSSDGQNFTDLQVLHPIQSRMDIFFSL